MIHAAALLHIATGTVYTLPRPARHHDIIRMICTQHGFKQVGGDFEQGFIAVGEYRERMLPTFVRRVPAKRIAELAGQILPGKGTTRELFSEDLW